jgi:hypothetical protein
VINIFEGAFIADFWGLLLSLPIALFLAFWLSSVKSRWAVVVGALVFAIIGFIIIYLWTGYPQDMPNLNPAAEFFGALFFNTIIGLIGGLVVDLLVARVNSRMYRRVAH